MVTALALALALEKTVLPNPHTVLPEVSLYKIGMERDDVAIIGTYGSLEACNSALAKQLKKNKQSGLATGKRAKLLCINWG